MNRSIFFLLVSLVLVAGCSKPEPAAVEAPVPAAAAPIEPAVPVPTEAEQALARHDAAVINFEGFGPAKFGADEEQVRMAWGHPLQAGTPAPGASCYQLAMDPMPADGKGILFMFEDDSFVRYDVDVPLHVAPGDIIVGSNASDVLTQFEGRVEDQPHKYIEGGRNLVVAPEDGGPARLVFEVDAAGFISAWRIGVPPQVHYVEGCG